MRWSRISYPGKIHMAEMLIGGFRKFMGRFDRTGANENYIKKLEELTGKAKKLKQKQNHLMAEHKTVTAELQEVLTELGKNVSKGKGIVKVELKKPLWVAFGITDKK